MGRRILVTCQSAKWVLLLQMWIWTRPRAWLLNRTSKLFLKWDGRRRESFQIQRYWRVQVWQLEPQPKETPSSNPQAATSTCCKWAINQRTICKTSTSNNKCSFSSNWTKSKTISTSRMWSRAYRTTCKMLARRTSMSTITTRFRNSLCHLSHLKTSIISEITTHLFPRLRRLFQVWWRQEFSIHRTSPSRIFKIKVWVCRTSRCKDTSQHQQTTVVSNQTNNQAVWTKTSTKATIRAATWTCNSRCHHLDWTEINDSKANDRSICHYFIKQILI